MEVYRASSSKLGHKVYGKSTHTNRYLDVDLHHHSAQKNTVLKLNELKTTFHVTGYNRDIQLDRRYRKDKTVKGTEEAVSVARLPYVRGMSDHQYYTGSQYTEMQHIYQQTINE
ncbi:uncharacterized protein LOC126298042 [Schistocerca gregaria]|uniref:uncharacterized protein LOC126298042 n=1 Tax=Schistocerca gregaria TaxID=7010 RepID=UPI00211F28AB|nr:uncharacterized protein LOC126298042 [Schistocerca gregaria]